jgi:hypothetical protein
MKQVEIKLKYRVDDPGVARALVAFFHKAQGKPLQDEINLQAIRELVNSKDWNAEKMELKRKGKRGSTSFPGLVEFIRQRAAANDRLFFVKLGRALTEGRSRKNAAIEDFLFKHWDRIQGSVDGKRAVSREDIGLKHFTDSAVVNMLQIRFQEKVLSLDAYRQIRKGRALKSEKPARFNRVERDSRGGITLFRKKVST